MNIELDRQIAILKGATHDLSGNAFTFYSESDSKALELVDELVSNPGWSFDLSHVDGGLAPWEARFQSPEKSIRFLMCPGSTRPEAICRAYIAAREWMEKQGKG